MLTLLTRLLRVGEHEYPGEPCARTLLKHREEGLPVLVVPDYGDPSANLVSR